MKEDRVLNLVCVAVALVALAVAPIGILFWGLTIDSLFLAAVCGTIAAIFAINPALMILGGALQPAGAVAGGGSMDMIEEHGHMEPKEVGWGGGALPYAIGSKKLGMWLFIISDSLTFAALLIGYS